MTASHRELIRRALSARAPRAESVAQAGAHTRTLLDALRDLEAARDQVLAEVAGLDAADRLSPLRSLDLSGLRLGLEESRQALLRLETRLRRPWLSVGVVGRARQGKSRLLQSVTGLDAAAIPDGDRTHCTGVRSTIVHAPEVEAHAEITLHTERSFFEDVVLPYYEALPELGAGPRSLEAWGHAARPQLDGLVGARAARLAHLQRIHEELPEFRTWLGHASPMRIPLSEVRRWVAQTSPDGSERYTAHRAARSVKITCAFPHDGLGQLQVVDMPGLGDTGVGDETRLLRTLGHEVDAVLFVRMPKPLGDHWADVDVGLYDLAARALPELALEQWSMLVLNRTRAGKQGDNAHNCQDLLADTERHGLRTFAAAIADASQPDEVRQDLLNPLLGYLAENIEALDRAYAQRCQDDLRQWLKQVGETVRTARPMLARAGLGDRENPLFRRLFDESWENLTGALESYLSRLQNRREEEDPDLAQEISTALERSRAEPGIPDLDGIERRRHARGSYAIAYHELLHEVRTQLSRHFLGLDDGLKRGLLAVKEGVGETLREVLGGSDARGSAYLETLQSKLPPEAEELGAGFELLLGFDLSYRGLIQHRIRRHLDGLTPDLTTLRLSERPDAEEVRAYLETLHKEALYQAEQALRGLLYEPNQAAFAMVEEFVDRVLRARGARTEWDIFLFEIRDEIWSDEFERSKARAATRRRWEQACARALEEARPEAFTFL